MSEVKNNNKLVNIVSGVVSVATMLLCFGKIAFAVQQNPISVKGTTGSIKVNGNTLTGATIKPNIVFNEIGDSITYEIPFSSPDGTEFKINSVNDDNKNAYIKTSYVYDLGMGAYDRAVDVTLTYVNRIPFGEELNLNDIHITFSITEAVKPEPATTEPTTPEPVVQEPVVEEPVIEEPTNAEETPELTSTTTIGFGSTTLSTGTNYPGKEPNAPDTGENGMKYLALDQAKQNDDIIPYVIIGLIALVGAIRILPKRMRAKYGMVACLLLSLTPVYLKIVNASSAIFPVTIDVTHISAMPDVSNPKDVVMFRFPNIYNNKVTDRPSGMAAGNSIIMKTMDNKYVLLDTGPETDDIHEVIYNELATQQGKKKVTIDYMIISHLDRDHHGNAEGLINDDRITIKNVILKHEEFGGTLSEYEEGIFAGIVQSAVAKGINVITSDNASTEEAMDKYAGGKEYGRLSEGMAIEVGKYLKLNFFNTANVYAGKECKSGKGVNYTSALKLSSGELRDDFIKTSDGKYIYFDGSKYPNITYHLTDTLIEKENGSGLNKYFYAISMKSHNVCVSNPDALAILVEVTTNDLKKYAYFANDIENAGASILDGGLNSSKIYKNLKFENGKFVNDITPYTILSETNAANEVYDKLSKDAKNFEVPVKTLLNNIVIYQESHHGLNNSEDAINKLNLNRKEGIYSILENNTKTSTSGTFSYAKTYWYTLGKIPAENKFRVGTKNGNDGVGCAINMIGETTCDFYYYK